MMVAGYGEEGGGSGSGSGGSGVPAADEASSERRKSTLATLGSEEVLCATGCAVLLFEMLRECAKTSRKRSVSYLSMTSRTMTNSASAGL